MEDALVGVGRAPDEQGEDVNEALLSALLDIEDAHALFTWLAGLSLMELRDDGLHLHSLPRTVIATHLRWRNPDWYEALGRRARAYYRRRVEGSSGAEQRVAVLDSIYLHRDNPVVRPYFRRLQQTGDEARVAWTDAAREEDWPALQEMVARHEGDESAQLFAYWAGHEAQRTAVYRDDAGHPLGFLMTVARHRCTPAEEEADPEALRNLTRPDKLQANPLLRSRLVTDRTSGDGPGIDTLQTLLKDTADELPNNGPSRKYYRALYHTYLQPAPTQEKAAEIINVPYGTFRRHLKRAVDRLADALWQQEIGVR